MKYIIMPVLRTFYLLVMFTTVLPLAFLFEIVLQSIWNFKLKKNWEEFKSHFSEEYFWVEDSEYLDHTIRGMYKVYPTLKDFVLNRWVLRKVK